MDPASIQALLERHLPRAAARCVVHGPVGAHQNSRIYRAECRDFPFPLLVKLCVHSNSTAPDPVTARAQFLGLQQAWSKTRADTHYRVPQPVLLLEPEGILVAEWVEAPTMTERLYAWRATNKEFTRHIGDAAEWLKRFHQAHRFPDVTLNCREILPRLLDGDPAVRDSALYRAGYALLRTTADRAVRVALECSYVHGDYKADNLLVDGDRVVAIDVQLDHRNAVLFDIASFLNHLELLVWHPRGLRIAMWHRGLVQYFIERYFGSPLSAERRVALLWVRLFNAMGAWIDLALDNKSRLSYQYMSFCYRALVRRLIREMVSVAGTA